MEDTTEYSVQQQKIGDTLHKQLLRMRPVIASAIKVCCVEFREKTLQAVENDLSPTPLLTLSADAVIETGLDA